MRISDVSSDVCSSDLTHLGNTYLLPGSGGGLLDWQLMVRGYHIHDVNYLITTALPIGERRAQERDLLCYYLDRLAAAGGRPLSFDDPWLEYRRALRWGRSDDRRVGKERGSTCR